MPTLAKKIVDENTTGKNAVLNFKGLAVGNPYTDVYSGTPAMIDTYWGHQLIPKPTYDSYQKDCINSVRPNVKECATLEVSMLNGIGNLNSYALDYPVCTTSSASKKGRAQRYWFLKHMHAESVDVNGRKLMGLEDEYEPCEDDYSSTYLNLNSVKLALHVKSSIKWSSCSNTLNYNSSDMDVSTVPIFNYLIDGGYKLNILVYSGDDDSVCATIGTQNWIWGLGYTVAGKAWDVYTVNEQTAGYFTQWKNTKLGFLTIHGAGHEVPTYKPAVALDMFTRFLKGEFTSA